MLFPLLFGVPVLFSREVQDGSITLFPLLSGLHTLYILLLPTVLTLILLSHLAVAVCIHLLATVSL